MGWGEELWYNMALQVSQYNRNLQTEVQRTGTEQGPASPGTAGVGPPNGAQVARSVVP